MRLELRPELCCGSGQCSRLVPEVFEQSEETGLVQLVRQPPVGGPAAATALMLDLDVLGAEVRAAAVEAALDCPVGALAIIAGPPAD